MNKMWKEIAKKFNRKNHKKIEEMKEFEDNHMRNEHIENFGRDCVCGHSEDAHHLIVKRCIFAGCDCQRYSEKEIKFNRRKNEN